METLFEILTVILPVIITGLITFFITKYKYNRNGPLDKLEFAYNRVYYPLYRIISDKNMSKDIDIVINKSSTYIIKYDKYIDISTKELFDELCNCNKVAKKKSIYQSFKNIIYDRNSYLRRRLGYLEPNLIQTYKFTIPELQSLYKIFIGLCVVYISLISCGVFMNRSNVIYNVSIIILVLSFSWFVLELIRCLLRFLYYKIRR